MEIVAFIIVLLLLFVITVQDFKYRAVHVIILLSLFLTSTFFYYNANKSLINYSTIAYTIIVFLFLWIYFSLKSKSFRSLFINYIGIGDFLFLISISPLFNLQSFIVFIITGIVFTIVSSILLRKKINNSEIPFAGILSGYLLIVCLLKQITDFDLINITFINTKI